MRILLINVPHTAIGSRVPDDHLPPFGLLCVGGPLIDAGHDVGLIDADIKPLSDDEILARTTEFSPECVMFGHSGSSSAQPTISRIASKIKAMFPNVIIFYGGVHPTYFYRELLQSDPWVDFIIRGEGEATVTNLINAIATQKSTEAIAGIAFRVNGNLVATPPAITINNLDDYRIGWELIDFKNYSYWGKKRAVVIQFSRGCPHLCTYCGQKGFWTKWRHRDPQKLADEIEYLNKVHGVEVFNFADENPSSGRKAWQAFLEAIIAKNLDITLVGSTRADDIVRDKDILHLYKKAGFERFLLGMENTDATTLEKIKKGATKAIDKEAIQLLRAHNILSMASYVVGFSDDTDADLWHGLKQLIEYDPDQIQALYAVPHRWTPFFTDVKDRIIVQDDFRKWDYKHQIIKLDNMPPWRLLLWVKFIELIIQTRPRAIMRLIYNREKKIRHAIRWYYKMGRRVWFREILHFLFRDNVNDKNITVSQYIGKPQEHEEYSMRVNNK